MPKSTAEQRSAAPDHLFVAGRSYPIKYRGSARDVMAQDAEGQFRTGAVDETTPDVPARRMPKNG